VEAVVLKSRETAHNSSDSAGMGTGRDAAARLSAAQRPVIEPCGPVATGRESLAPHDVADGKVTEVRLRRSMPGEVR
jgi:hypothetical protein